jgi:hypothetical protein
MVGAAKRKSALPAKKSGSGRKVRAGSNATSSVSTSSSRNTNQSSRKQNQSPRPMSQAYLEEASEEENDNNKSRQMDNNDQDDPSIEADEDSDGQGYSDEDNHANNKTKKAKGRVYTYTVENKRNKQSMVERTDDNDATTDITPVNKVAPNALWTGIEESMKQVKVEKTAVHDFVSNYLFPKLKFVRGSGLNMDYSTEDRSICALVMNGCHQAHSTEGIIWWGIARKQTIKEIKRLRNDASKNLKTAFLGKYNRNRDYKT